MRRKLFAQNKLISFIIPQYLEYWGIFSFILYLEKPSLAKLDKHQAL
ncbi:MAG: hypothetical protein WAP36_08375 [Halanaerobiales bacterium]